MIKYTIISALAVSLFLLEPVSGEDNDSLPAVDTSRIMSAEQAFARLYEFAGFPELRAVPRSSLAEVATLAVAEECEVPFLAHSVIGRQVWKLKLENVRVDTSPCSKERIEKYNPKSFEAWIDAKTGQLIKIFSRYEGHDPDLAPEPPADSAAKQMRQTGEVFVGFPSEPPPVTFLQALGAAAGSNPLEAKEIFAVCVLMSRFGEKAVPVWSIIGRGITPVEIHESNAPMYRRNRMRSIVNANTGRLATVTNCPNVLRREEDR